MSRPASSWHGLPALLLLMRLQLRARAKGAVRSLRRPRRLALLLVVAFFLGMAVLGQRLGGDEQPFGGQTLVDLYPLLMLVFVVTTALNALVHGVLAFGQAEVHFLFPAPVGSRALLAAHVIGSALKSVSAALVFALFLRPGGVPFLRAAAAWMLFFLLLVLLGLVLDVKHMGLPAAVRRRRALWAGLGAAAVAGLVVLLAARAQGAFGLDALRPLALPLWPLTQVLFAPDAAGLLAGLAVTAVLLLLLAVPVLTFRGDVREAAHHTSERVQRKLARFQQGQLTVEAPTVASSGRLLPMLPRWGGAGVHVWRQLTALLRLRRTYVMLLVQAVVVGVVMAVVQRGAANVEAVAGAVLGMLAFAGPMTVQCDFRADADVLPWLRSLPTPPAALAAGQLLAPTLVLWALELLAGGWIVVAAPGERWWLWLGVLAVLPWVNLVQLALENGAWLLYPTRPLLAKGPPGAAFVGRMYALMLVKFVTLGVFAGIAALVAWAAWALLGIVAAVLAAAAVLGLEAAACVVFVGRLFTRVDVARDLVE